MEASELLEEFEEEGGGAAVLIMVWIGLAYTCTFDMTGMPWQSPVDNVQMPRTSPRFSNAGVKPLDASQASDRACEPAFL